MKRVTKQELEEGGDGDTGEGGAGLLWGAKPPASLPNLTSHATGLLKLPPYLCGESAM